MKGASQIKLMAGGGVSSSYDPLDVVQFTEDEMRTAVEVATAWKTYVAVHIIAHVAHASKVFPKGRLVNGHIAE
jgi:imidazolonepropionase-like amidohydrolase